MLSKLDELARKEEELRRINDQLDLKKNKILSGDAAKAGFVDLRNDPEFLGGKKGADVAKDNKSDAEDDEEDKESNNSFDQFKGKNLGGAAAAKFADDEDDYGDGNFEKDELTLAASNKSKKQKASDLDAGIDVMDSLKDKFQIRMDEDDDDIAAVVAAGRKAKASALA